MTREIMGERGGVTATALGRAVRETRKAKGYRQADVAAAAGVGVRFVGDLERGKQSVRLDHALRVTNALGIELRIDSESSGRGDD